MAEATKREGVPVAAGALKISVSLEVFRRLLARGEIKGWRDPRNGRWFADAASLQSWIERHTPPPTLPDANDQTVELARRYYTALIEKAAVLREIAGNASAAEQAGDPYLAQAWHELAETLSDARAHWDAERSSWRLEVPSLGVVRHSQAVGVP
jgi:hypothetical protein